MGSVRKWRRKEMLYIKRKNKLFIVYIYFVLKRYKVKLEY